MVSDAVWTEVRERLKKFQSALRFAVVSDHKFTMVSGVMFTFQSALRFAVVSDDRWHEWLVGTPRVSIRFEVRGGFRPN